jgi:hypothetical protein
MIELLMRNSRNVYRYAGHKETVDGNGEAEKAIIVIPKRQDVNFVKIFLPERGYHMFPKEMIASARVLLDYLCVVMDRQNMAIAPTVEIEERIDLSESSISRGRKQLVELDFVRLRGQGMYMINPAYICRVDGDKRAELYDQYSQLPIRGTK